MTITHPDVLSLTTGIRTVIDAARWIGVCHPSSADGSPDIAVELGELKDAVEAVSKVEGAPDGLLRDLDRLSAVAGFMPLWEHETGMRRQLRALVEDALPAWLHLFVGLSVRGGCEGSLDAQPHRHRRGRAGESEAEPTQRLLTVRALADYLGVAVQTVRNHAHDIPGRKKLGSGERGGKVLYDRQIIDKWIEENNGVTDLWLDGRRMVK